MLAHQNLDQRIRHWNHRRIDKMRAWKLRLAMVLFGGFSKFTGNQAHKILILRLDGKVGDSVTSTGFLRSIKQNYPNHHLIVATNQAANAVYSSLDFVDQVLISKKGLIPTLRLFSQLRNSEYHFIVNTSHILTPQVIFLCSFLRAFKKIGFGKQKGVFSDHVEIDFQRDHVTDRYRKALALVGIADCNLSYQVEITNTAREKAQAYVQKLRKQFKHIVVLNSFAGGRMRNFSQTTSQQIVSQILQQLPDSCVISVANSGDHRILQNWISTNQTRWVHNTELSGLQENVALLACSDLLVTPDTAWVHIASALKKKVVAVYREDRNHEENNAVIWGPYGTVYKVVTAPAIGENPDDINNVNIEELVKSVLAML